MDELINKETPDAYNKFRQIIANEKNKPYYIQLKEYIDREYMTKTIYPKKENIFEALELTPYENVRVVILGQDPYHGENEAHGLAFSVNCGVKVPPSLKNIYKELKLELGLEIPNNGFLVKWAKQGVLLLNSVLTVEKDKPASHQKKGFETLTDTIISQLNERKEPIIFMLWGNFAKSKQVLITNDRHLILTSTHPSPFSAHNGFFGCGHFAKANEFLKDNNLLPIDWQIENI